MSGLIFSVRAHPPHGAASCGPRTTTMASTMNVRESEKERNHCVPLLPAKEYPYYHRSQASNLWCFRKTTMTTLLPASLQNSLQEIVERANQRAACIRAILLSTMEGVPLGRVISDQALNEDVLASIESVWAPASKQFPVLGLDKVKQVTAIYDHGTLVHIYQAPMVSSMFKEDTRSEGDFWLYCGMS
jgi:Mitogen-activated protein kinase kinase 1 interacting